MSEASFPFDLQLFAELPAIGDAKDGTVEKHLEPLSDDFDAVLSAEQSAARERPVESFVAAQAAADDLSGAVDATSAEDLQAAAVVAKRDDAAPADASLDEAVAADDVTAAPVVAEKAKPSEKITAPAEPVAAEPIAAKPAEPVVAAVTAATPTYAPDEVVQIAADRSMTRDQLTKTLDFTNVAMTEANTFRDIFGITADQAKAVWKPVIDGIRQDPSRAEFFDKMAEIVADPGARAYVEKAVKFFEEARKNGDPEAQPRQPVVAKPAEPYKDPRVDAMLAQQQRAQMEAASIAIGAEKRSMLEKWPQLADERLMRTVAIEALNRINGDPQRGVAPDPTYTLTRAAQDMVSYIDRFGTPAAPVAAVAAAPVKVPALNGSGGASPTGSRRADTAPKTYANPDAALDAWVEEHPDDYRA